MLPCAITHRPEPRASDTAAVRVLVAAIEDGRSRRVAHGLAKAGFYVVARHSPDLAAFPRELGPFAVALVFVDSFGDASDRALASVESLFPPPQVILLCQDLRHLPPEYLLRVFAAVPQEYDDTLLLVLVRAAAGAGPPSTIGRFCSRYRLSQREREVVELFCAGRANKETADHLGLSGRTVDEYWKRIFAKTQRRSRREIVALLLDSDTSFQRHGSELPAATTGPLTIPACQYFPGQRLSAQNSADEDP